MKKLFLSFAMLLAIVGCSSDDTTEGGGDNEQPNTPTECNIYSATIESAEKFGFEWSVGSSISFFSTTQNEMFAYNIENGKFEKADTSNPTRVSTPNLFGVYPYATENRAAKSGEITFVTPTEQPYKADGVDFAVSPMLAIAELSASELEFKHLFGYLNIPIYTILPEGVSALTIKNIKFIPANGKPIAGTASFETDNVIDAMYDFNFGKAGQSQITVNCGEGAVVGTTAEAATSFHFVLPPATYTNGCVIEVVALNGISYSKTISSTFSIERGEVTALPVVDIVVDANPEMPESILADIQFANDADNKPVATDAVSGMPVNTIYLGNQTQNVWVSDAPEGYTLNKIATFGKDEPNLSYFDLIFTDVKAEIQDGFTIEVIHRDPHAPRFSENGWRALFGGRDFGLWITDETWGPWHWDARIWPNVTTFNGSVNPVSANVWHHTTYVYDAEAEKLQVYTDGVLEVDKACGKMRDITKGHLPIGARSFSGSDTFKFPWGGDIALFRIYDEAITKDQATVMCYEVQAQIDALNSANAQ